MANIQISEELFMNLIKYHLVGLDELSEAIKHELQIKLDKVIERKIYTTYKTAPTEEEREEARIEYLNLKGIHKDFRF